MRSFIRRTRTAAADDEGSGLILVFLVILISSALSLVLLGSAVSTAKQTQANNKRVTSLSAAQAGLDAGLGQIRSSLDGTGQGDITVIPCTVAPGQVGGTGLPSQGSSTGSYTISVRYYATDPTGQSKAWRSDSANLINCPQNGHPDKVPSFALLESTGHTQGVDKPRTVDTTYTFTNSNKNISGGLIHVSGGGQGTTPDLCPDAGSGHPSTGVTLTMQTCDKTDPGQIWAYQTDLSMLLTSTINDATPMCMQLDTTPAPLGSLLKVAPCTGLPGAGTVTLSQEFSYDDSGSFEDSHIGPSATIKADHPTLSGHCWVVTTPNTIGSTLQINNCGTIWRPEAAVGAGMSGDGKNVGLNTMQLVNFQEFGRCLDATGQNADAAYMIAFPCKQSPTASEITWNQKYTYDPTAHTISTAIDGGTYKGQTWCLTSPMAKQTTPTLPGPFVVLKVCPSPSSPTPTNMNWTELGNSTGNYQTDYTILDSSTPPLCLAVGLTGTGVPAVTGLGEWSSIYTQPCDGTTGQKWNAPPNVPAGSVTGTNETTTGSGG